MVHTKKALERISHAQAIATLVFLLAWLRINHPKIYKKTERRLGILGGDLAKSRSKRRRNHARRGRKGHKMPHRRKDGRFAKR